MLKVIFLALIVAAARGQTPTATPEKTPPRGAPAPSPEIDAALRARISQFYQFEVDGKYNQALQLVADDTKDLFVGTSKPSIYNFEIKSIQYSDDFKKAQAIVMLGRMFPIEGFMGRPLAMKSPSRWKLENGEWCYYVDPKLDIPSTPFGPMGPAGMPPPGMPRAGISPPGMPSPGMPAATGGQGGSSRAMPPPLPSNLPDPRALTVDKKDVKLKLGGLSADQVTISNPSPWSMTLTLSGPAVAGLEVKLDNITVRPGGKALVSIHSTGDIRNPAVPLTYVVTVQQTKQTFPIKVSFAN